MGIDCSACLIVGWKIDVIKLLEWLTDELKIKQCDINYSGIINSIPEDTMPTGWTIEAYCPYYDCPQDEQKYYFHFDFKGEKNYSECVKLLTEEQIKGGVAFVQKFGVTEPMKMMAVESWW